MLLRRDTPTLYWQAIVAQVGRPSTRYGMSHLCDSTVASPAMRRDNVLASKCEYPPFLYPPFLCKKRSQKFLVMKVEVFEGEHVVGFLVEFFPRHFL